MESKVGSTRIIVFIVILVVVIITLFSLNVFFTLMGTAVGAVLSIVSFGLLTLPALGYVVGSVVFNAVTFIGGTYLIMWLVSMIMTWSVYAWGGWIGWNLIWPLPWLWRIFSGHMLGE